MLDQVQHNTEMQTLQPLLSEELSTMSAEVNCPLAELVLSSVTLNTKAVLQNKPYARRQQQTLDAGSYIS